MIQTVALESLRNAGFLYFCSSEAELKKQT